MPPSPFSALPPLNFFSKASPKAISGRTSYLCVRLAFHPYPQVIRSLFNVSRFGPPRNFTSASSCSWVDHTVSGLHNATLRPFQTCFRFGSEGSPLNLAALRNSPVRSTKSTLSRTNPLQLFVSIRFQVLFHSSSEVLFTFPSRYWFTIGH